MVLLQEAPKIATAPSRQVRLNGGFWGARLATNRDRTIPAIYHQMSITGRLDAWRLDWQPGKPKPHIFWDSDAGKWIESVAYSLMNDPNPTFEQQVDDTAKLIAAAQQPDGYLNIFFTAVEPQKKWTNLRDWHELYDAGHLIEGAVAYYQATGKRTLLDVLTRYADHIDTQFGVEEGKRRGYCGHPEIELALVKLAEETGNPRYFQLAKYFVDERGHQPPHYFDVEAIARGESPGEYWARTYEYCQAHIPVREQTTAVGHSVRACYLYAGMADVAARTGDAELLSALRALWDDLTTHQMYITGGIGPTHRNEGFTFQYDLPNEDAYAETCASIALVFWARRMFQIDPDSRYIDVMERALYNGILSGVSYDGETFFYANPLASHPRFTPYAGQLIDGHYRRVAWYECACCPPNLARIVASVGGYFYSIGGDTLYVHLYNQGQANLTVGGTAVTLTQATDYPYDGVVKFTVGVAAPAHFTLALRIPDWCRQASVSINGQPAAQRIERGYWLIEREWAAGDEVQLDLAMPVERMVSHPNVRQDAGQVALQRGPIVYCFEQADNGAGLAHIAIPKDAELMAEFDPELFGGTGVISGTGIRTDGGEWGGGLYRPRSAQPLQPVSVPIKAIPYFLWCNREPGEMRVWMREI